jgi:DNA-binding NtrC family response regulator
VEDAMKRPVVLVHGIEDILYQNLKRRLVHHEFSVIESTEQSDTSEQILIDCPELVIVSSYRKAFGKGIKEIKRIRQLDKDLPIILIAGKSSEAKAIAAIKAGANDYFKLPFSCEVLAKRAKRILQTRSHRSLSNEVLKRQSSKIDKCIIGQSKSMQEVKSHLLNVAQYNSTVLITGETGTGKELAANLIHLKSPRHKSPFVCVNCAALPESLVESELFGYDQGAFTGATADKPGKFELAKGGTVFLDEISDMNKHAQAKILRSIESKDYFHLGGKDAITFDARVVAATNQDPEQLISKGIFRKDLYYRLNVARIHLPPLRERKEDIPNLVKHTLQKLNFRFNRKVEGLTEEAMTCLFRYGWPGNVRELMNLLEAVYINLPSKPITIIDLPKQIQKQLNFTASSTQKERERIISALLETNWNKSTAAQKLNWSRMTLYRKLAKYNIIEKRSHR